jgi:hypothetical protein
MSMESIAEAVRGALVKGELPCASAFVIAERLGVEPLRVGQVADALGVRLSKCQLGLFGYGPKAEGKHRRVAAMQNVPHDVAEAMNAALGEDDRLTCVAAWHISDQLGVPKQRVSDAAEGLGVRIGDCQLGAF